MPLIYLQHIQGISLSNVSKKSENKQKVEGKTSCMMACINESPKELAEVAEKKLKQELHSQCGWSIS